MSAIVGKVEVKDPLSQTPDIPQDPIVPLYICCQVRRCREFRELRRATLREGCDHCSQTTVRTRGLVAQSGQPLVSDGKDRAIRREKANDSRDVQALGIGGDLQLSKSTCTLRGDVQAEIVRTGVRQSQDISGGRRTWTMTEQTQI